MSNMLKRIIVALAAAPVILYSPYAGTKYFTLFIFVISFLGSKELTGFFKRKHQRMNALTPYLTSALPLIFLQYGYEIFTAVFIFFIFVLFFLEIFRKTEKPTAQLSGYLLILVYCGIFPSLLIGSISTAGPVMFIYIYSIIIATDTFAYFGGLTCSKLFRTHKLLERISPKKTVEGAASGLIFAVITAYFIREYTDIKFILSLQSSAILSILISVFGQTGDLFESMLKRDCNVKDSSNIIPGHGGILDRFDSLIFVSPVVYIYLNYFT